MALRSKTRHVRDPYIPSDEYENVLKSAILILAPILTNKEVLEFHKKNVIRDCILWRMSEVDGKWRTRYRSVGVMEGEDEKVNHDHVFTRKTLTSQLLEHPENVEQILRTVIGCVVTVSEHDKLKSFKHLEGWDRYKAAGVHVIDTKTSTRVT